MFFYECFDFRVNLFYKPILTRAFYTPYPDTVSGQANRCSLRCFFARNRMFVLALRSINLLFIDAVSKPNLVQPVQEFANKFDDHNVLTFSLMKRSYSFQLSSCLRRERGFFYRAQRKPTAQLLPFLPTF